MIIRVHRGTHQIGGCVTEYEYNGYRLFVDYGEELPGGQKSGNLEVEGLTKGDISKSALLITHYHGDHIGCITMLPKDLPIFMGKVGRGIQIELSDYLKTVNGVHQEMLDRLQTVKTFEPGKPFGPDELYAAIDRRAIQILDDATIADMKAKRERDRQRDEEARRAEAIAKGEPVDDASDWKKALEEWNNSVHGS